MWRGEVVMDVTLPEGVTLVRTCEACPEQYDVQFDGRQVGYVRLRHSWFAAWSPDLGGKCVLSEEYDPYGHGDQGYLTADDYEPALQRAVEAVLRHVLSSAASASPGLRRVDGDGGSGVPTTPLPPSSGEKK